jgi:hypothetical protein
MIANPFGGMTSPSLPTLSDIQHRIAELESVQQQLDTQAQLQIRSAPRTPPPPSAPPNPILSEAALYGVAGSAVRTLAPAHRGPSRRHSPPVAGRVRQCRWSRAPQRIPQRIVQNPNECSFPRPSQQQPHRCRARTTHIVGCNRPKQPAHRGTPRYPLVCDTPGMLGRGRVTR